MVSKASGSHTNIRSTSAPRLFPSFPAAAFQPHRLRPLGARRRSCGRDAPSRHRSGYSVPRIPPPITPLPILHSPGSPALPPPASNRRPRSFHSSPPRSHPHPPPRLGRFRRPVRRRRALLLAAGKSAGRLRSRRCGGGGGG